MDREQRYVLCMGRSAFPRPLTAAVRERDTRRGFVANRRLTT